MGQNLPGQFCTGFAGGGGLFLCQEGLFCSMHHLESLDSG